jgi:hypothetical protein
MLRWTTAGQGVLFGLLARHTDGEREWPYGKDSSTGDHGHWLIPVPVSRHPGEVARIHIPAGRTSSVLVTFSCPVYADITLFGDVAVRLLRLMGHSGRVPGALLSADVPEALERLEAAIEAERQQPGPEEEEEDEASGRERVVPFAHRAFPLIELLRAAVREKSNVMWDIGN